jgi:hypothetical protein
VNIAPKGVWMALLAAAAGGGEGLFARNALAQEARQEVLRAKHKNFESPQHFAFELRFSPFTPDIDSDPALHGQTPYALAFGTPSRLLIAAELDWQAARIPHVGTIGPALGIGYAWAERPAFLAPPLMGFSGETTTLQIFPMYAVGVLRADVLWREVGIPLVPYAKLGLGMAFWRASNTLGTSHYQGASGLGHSLGTQLALGLGLSLNVFDEYAARSFDESMGVNGTYLFAEWSRSDLNGLWFQQDPLRVGGTYWTFGLAFEF